MAREEAERDFPRRIGGRINGKKASSKENLSRIKSMRVTLLNLKLLGELP